MSDHPRVSPLVAQMVVVDWERSPSPTADWSSDAALYEAGVEQAISVGFLIREDWETTVLAAGVSGLEEDAELELSGILRIPTSAIRTIRRLVEAEDAPGSRG